MAAYWIRGRDDLLPQPRSPSGLRHSSVGPALNDRTRPIEEVRSDPAPPDLKSLAGRQRRTEPVGHQGEHQSGPG